MAGGPLAKQRSEAAWRGRTALAAWIGSGLALLLSWPWWLVLGGVVASGALTWRWFQYRARWGMRF